MVLLDGTPLAPGILLLALLVAMIVPSLLAYWVYTDARRRGDDDAERWAMLVGGLTYLTLVGGILALLLYVRNRE